MELNIKYFGIIAEITHCNEEIFEFSDSTISELIEFLFGKYPELENKDFKVAQNQEFVSVDTIISGEELALLPPFSGG